MRDLAKEKEEQYKEECINYYDRKAKERKFDVGDLVLVRNLVQNFRDLANFFLGHM